MTVSPSIPGERGGRRVGVGARHGAGPARGGGPRLPAGRAPRAAGLPRQRQRQAAPAPGGDQTCTGNKGGTTPGDGGWGKN